MAAGLLLRGEDDPYGDYCAAVEEHQQEIGVALGDGDAATGFLRALPSLEAVAAQAPDDVRDEWRTVIDRITAFGDVLRTAGVDPASYDPTRPPPDLDEAQQAAIEVAADRLAAAETREALAAVDQQVRDVCQTRLSL